MATGAAARFRSVEHPVALQLGGVTRAIWRKREDRRAVRLRRDQPECRLSVGSGPGRSFGACLMAEPALVADCVHAMKRRCHPRDRQVPASASTIRIRRWRSMRWRRSVVAAGADALIVHARKAWLHGLSPKENRDIPPLDYDRVYRLKASMPDLPVIINGGNRRSRRGQGASWPCRWRDAGARGLSRSVAFAGGGSRIVRRAGAIQCDEGRVRGDGPRTSRINSRRARGCIRWRGISSAHFTACRAHARSAATLPTA